MPCAYYMYVHCIYVHTCTVHLHVHVRMCMNVMFEMLKHLKIHWVVTYHAENVLSDGVVHGR